MSFLFGLPGFRGYVKFPGCIDYGYPLWIPGWGTACSKKIFIKYPSSQIVDLIFFCWFSVFFSSISIWKNILHSITKDFVQYLKWRNPRKPIYKLPWCFGLWKTGKTYPPKWSAIRWPRNFPFFGTWNCWWFKVSIKNWMVPYQRTPKKVTRAIKYPGLGVRSVGPAGDFLESWRNQQSTSARY